MGFLKKDFHACLSGRGLFGTLGEGFSSRVTQGGLSGVVGGAGGGFLESAGFSSGLFKRGLSCLPFLRGSLRSSWRGLFFKCNTRRTIRSSRRNRGVFFETAGFSGGLFKEGLSCLPFLRGTFWNNW